MGHTMQNKMLTAQMPHLQQAYPEPAPASYAFPPHNKPTPLDYMLLMGGGGAAAGGALGGPIGAGAGLAGGALGGLGAYYGFYGPHSPSAQAEDAYNNEYGPNNQAPIGLGPNGPIFR